MAFNPQIFSVVGYISVGLLFVLPVLWLIHWKMRPRKWLCYVALVLACVTFAMARMNSTKHVNRIEEDRSEQIARAADAIEKERKRKEAERAEDVADVRFIEDSGSDFLDKAGMDKTDAAYYEHSEVDEGQPEWKREKTQRVVQDEESMLADLGGVEDKEGMDTSVVEKEMPPPIVMEKEEVALAHRLDTLNIRFARWAIWFGIGFILVDYLRRFHSYEDSYLPLPLPHSVTQALNAGETVLERPEIPRRELENELALLIKQGATFLLLSDSPDRVNTLPEQLARLPYNTQEVEVLPTNYDGERVSPEFIFEELWFGRTAFVESDSDFTHLILAKFSTLLSERRSNGAHARRLVVLVWNREEEIPEIFEENIRILGPQTGFRLFKS